VADPRAAAVAQSPLPGVIDLLGRGGIFDKFACASSRLSVQVLNTGIGPSRSARARICERGSPRSRSGCRADLRAWVAGDATKHPATRQRATDFCGIVARIERGLAELDERRRAGAIGEIAEVVGIDADPILPTISRWRGKRGDVRLRAGRRSRAAACSRRSASARSMRTRRRPCRTQPPGSCSASTRLPGMWQGPGDRPIALSHGQRCAAYGEV
jgi:hypothetical protein